MRISPAFLVALLPVALLGPLAACVDDESKGEEEEVPLDGKFDSFRTPTEHGPIAFATPAHAVLTELEHHHTWTFELWGDAKVDMTTSYSLLGQRKTDTVLYLYKKGANGGWGSYIARNDDYDGKVYSQIIRNLGAGEYRVLVKGYLESTRGKFKITVGCNGAGCQPPPPPASGCLFGEYYDDIFAQPALTVVNTNVITAATLGTLTPADQQRLMVAVQQSAHTDVTTPLEAIGRVDRGEVNVNWLSEPAARRSYIVFEYAVGDSPYGAIFDHVSGAMVTSVHDTELQACTVVAETCRLPEDYTGLREDAGFYLNEDRVITSASQLDAAETDQVLAALRRTYPDVATVTAGLALVDDHRVSYRIYFYNGTNTDLAAVEFGAGDTSVGAVYYYRSMQIAAVIEDLFLYGCSLFAPKGGVALGGSCRGAGDCVTGLQCTGFFAGAGVCVSTADVPGEGNECTTDASCGSPALVCAGASRGGGLCNPAWMRGTFEDATTTQIPDGATLANRLVVRGLATVDTDVMVHATIDHPRASQLRVTLANPAGSELLVHDGVPADDGHPLVLDQPMGFSGDESVNGEWTLRVQDRTTGQTGTVTGWTLTVTSRWD